MEQKSQMVMASKYELEVKVKGGTAYQIDGQRTLIHGNKFIARWYVEMRNEAENNEHYVIDEEATEKAYILREKEMKEKAIKAKKESVTMADLVGVVAEAVADKPKKEKKVEVVEDAEEIEQSEGEEETVESLRAECDALNIEYHPRAGVKKLKELLNK